MKLYVGFNTMALKQHFGKKLLELEEERRAVQQERDRLLAKVDNRAANTDRQAIKLQYTHSQKLKSLDAQEFAEAYKSFHVGEKLANELATPYDKSKSHPAALSTKKYCIGMKQMFKKHNQGMYVGALFIVVIMIMFNGMAEINLTILKLSDFFKQREPPLLPFIGFFPSNMDSQNPYNIF
ncbi:pleiotropic drug resistance protein 1-like [Capsicum chacoense]